MIKYLRIGFLLFAFFLTYRLYFWGDVHQSLQHSAINAAGDAILSVICGLLVYRIRNRLFEKRVYSFVISSLVLIGFTFSLYLFHVLVYTMHEILTADFTGLFNTVCFQLLDSAAIIASGMFVTIIEKINSDKAAIQISLSELKQEKLQEELKYLKARMDPHFIFNSLNTIFYQLEESEEAARKSILQFSDVLRYHIYLSGSEKVPFTKELQFIKSYLDFQAGRRSDFTEVQSRFEISDPSCEIEPLLFLPLLENAFKFGKGNIANKGLITLFIKLNSKQLLFELSNTYDIKELMNLKGSGLGLENVMKRLKLIYDNRFSFLTDINTENNRFTCKLEIRRG